MKQSTHHTERERQAYFWWLLALFLLATTGLSYLMFRGGYQPFARAADRDSAFLMRQHIFEKKQEAALAVYDSGFAKIDRYRYMPSSVLEAEIKADIRQLNMLYDTSARSDPRTICFQQMAAFLEMYLTDAIHLRKSLSNAELFQQQLADCRMGLDRRGEQIRAATPTRQ